MPRIRPPSAARRFQNPNPGFHPASAAPSAGLRLNSSSEEEEEEGDDCRHSEFLPSEDDRVPCLEDDRVPCLKCSEFLLPDEAIAHEKACEGDTVQIEDFVGMSSSPITGLEFLTDFEYSHGPSPKKAKLGANTGCEAMIKVDPWSSLFVISRPTEGMLLDLFYPELKAHYSASSGFLHHVVGGERPRKQLREEDIRRLFRTAMDDEIKRDAMVRMAQRNSESLPIHCDYFAAAFKGEIQPYDVLAKSHTNTLGLNFQGLEALAVSIGESLNYSDTYPATLKFKRSNDEEVDLCRSWPGRSWDRAEWVRSLDLRATVFEIRGSFTTRLFWENLFGVLGNLDILSHLRLDANLIGDPECLLIAKLMEGGQLKRLSLQSNCIGDEGARSLAAGLKGCHCQVEVLDLQANNIIYLEGWKAIKEALCVRTTIAATSQSNHTLASLVYTPGPLQVGIPTRGIPGVPDEVAMSLNALLHINGNDHISPAKEKVWGVHFSNIRAAHFSREPGEAERDRTGMQELFDIIASNVQLAPHILTVFNKHHPPPEEGRVVRVYNPSLSNCFGVVRALAPELFGRPSMERERMEASTRKTERKIYERLEVRVEELEAQVKNCKGSSGIEEGGGYDRANVVQVTEEEDSKMPAIEAPQQISDSVWVCDICKARRFDSFEEAKRHEDECKPLLCKKSSDHQ